jgi:multidrug efflux pump subunit AcrB
VCTRENLYLRDVASQSIDGVAEPTDYVLYAHATGAPKDATRVDFPAVTITLAKRKGTNATVISQEAEKKIQQLRGYLLPADLNITVTRNYGETAKDKSDELLKHLLLATLSVTLLIALALGWRESGVVLIAIPVTLALTLFIFYVFGYTLNRVTLFALIFSIGILVDDAIVVVENVVRHFRLPINKGRPLPDVAVEAVDEVGNPTILATFTVIAAILPMAFVRGLNLIREALSRRQLFQAADRNATAVKCRAERHRNPVAQRKRPADLGWVFRPAFHQSPNHQEFHAG